MSGVVYKRCRRWGQMISGAVILAGLAATGMAAGVLAGVAAEPITRAANRWLESLDAGQRERAVRPFADAMRTAWHFVPKNDRKGVQLRDMTDEQQEAALALLRSVVSATGYDKATGIMQLDELLGIIEGEKAKNIRDAKRYYVTLFGAPADTGSWGLSIEGHHLSLNVTIRDGVVVDSTPQFLGANPAEVKTTFPGLPPTGHRVLRDEETLAFELVNSLDGEQQRQAVIAAEPPREIRAAGEPQAARQAMVGIAYVDLNTLQQAVLRRLVEVYCRVMPDAVAEERLGLIDRWDDVHFAWAGSLEPGIGHAYRVEGPTFAIEFVNVQPDAEGNPANHIHCIWRDRTGDFDLPAE
jgi:hypothetical protein